MKWGRSKSNSVWSETKSVASSYSTPPRKNPTTKTTGFWTFRLYSRGFRADRASILLQELGLVNQHLRTHLADRHKFFDAKERLQKIKGAGGPR